MSLELGSFDSPAAVGAPGAYDRLVIPLFLPHAFRYHLV